jgi:iron complex outermembrane recepter protein
MTPAARKKLHWEECVLIVIVLVCSMAVPAESQTGPPVAHPASVTGDLTQMSIEDLMNLEVTSGAKKEEPIQRTAAAIFVITGEDIRRSGATTLPDALRMVPGLDVAQISGNTWAISSRGFNDAFANKMLVLVDGRTVYSPVFSGVLWDTEDLLLADIDRIEVIRGPGAALWGTNAVNGVINIISKTASKTQGILATAAGGNVEGGYGSAQYGGQIGGEGFYRIFAKGFAKNSVPGVPGQGPQDGWDLGHGGFRTDWTLSPRDSLTVEGDLYRSSGQGTTDFTTSLAPLISAPLPGILINSGGNLLAHWHRTFSTRSEINLLGYYDRANSNTSFIRAAVNTFDVELEHRIAIGNRHEIVWGAGYRRIDINTTGTVAVSFAPPRISENLANAFVQDEIELLPGRLRLTLGGRVERVYGGKFNFQPDARILWTPTERQSVWLAASRALRGISPADASVISNLGTEPGPGGILVVPQASGNPNMRSEALVAFQAGYRAELTSTISIDATAFFNKYTRLRGEDTGTPIFETGSGIPFLLVPETADNKISGETHGIEFSGTWKPVRVWKLSGAYTWLDGALHDGSFGAPPNTTASTLSSPHHQFSIRSNINLPHRLEVDTALYRVGPLDTFGVAGYYRLDARFGWHVGEHAEFAIVGQNLLSANHMESPSEPDWFAAASVRRSYYARVTWHFQGSPKK